jgi:Baseplate J-like protein
MPEFLEIPVDNDPDLIAQQSYDYLQGEITGWVPNEANLETVMIDAESRSAAQTRDQFSRVPRSIFRAMGPLVKTPPINATKATVATTWTMINNAGYTIPAGTQIGIRTPGGDLELFEVLADTLVPPGSTATSAGGVLVIAVEPGLAGSGLGTVGGAVTLVTPRDYIVSVVQTAVTAGGSDAETDDEYLKRLSDRLSLLGDTLVLARDFAAAAVSLVGGRALPLDGYNPGDDTFSNEKYVAVALIDDAGAARDAPTKAIVDDYCEANREINFIFNVIDPTTNAIKVTYNIHVVTGYDPTDVIARVDAALSNYLDPANWGRPRAGTNFGAATDWVNTPVVRYLEIAQIINDVVGVDYITTTAGNYDLQIALQANALGRLDVALTGRAPLADAGTLVGTSS